ncbi:hypothetical protein [Desulfosporosinus sp. OT]|uniref:hypothetical protein n=1 Tax=Desulfosporosinus sp. OT TaxID=913865 RepID=UPI000223A830|nr:hypothetical protein [Desulfosporosinus sp. OT]EGW36290.1 hypothetical protein DOT_5795 [Desulfosporosinus sp. OT]
MVVQDDRLTTLNLLNLEIFGSFIGVISLSLFIFISYTSKNIILTSYLSGRNLRPTFSLDDAALVGRILLVLAGFIAANTTTMRLMLLIQKVLRNEPLEGPLIPNIWLTIGIWTSFVGGLIALVGDYERAQLASPRLPVE